MAVVYSHTMQAHTIRITCKSKETRVNQVPGNNRAQGTTSTLTARKIGRGRCLASDWPTSQLPANYQPLALHYEAA